MTGRPSPQWNSGSQLSASTGVEWRGLGLTVFAGKAFADAPAFRSANSRERLILVRPSDACDPRVDGDHGRDPIRAAFPGSEVSDASFGSLNWTSAFRDALGAFFAYGGETALVFYEPRLDRSLWVGDDAGPGQRSGLYFLADIESISTVVLPGLSTPEQRDSITRFASRRPHLQFLLEAESNSRDPRDPEATGSAVAEALATTPTTSTKSDRPRDVFDKRWPDVRTQSHPFPSRLPPFLADVDDADIADATDEADMRDMRDMRDMTQAIDILRSNVAVVRSHGHGAVEDAPGACGTVAAYLAATDFCPAGKSPAGRREGGKPAVPFGAPAAVFWPLRAWRRWEGLRRSIDLCTRSLVLQADHPLVYRRVERQVRGFLRDLAEKGLLDRFAPLEAVCQPAAPDSEDAPRGLHLAVTARLCAPRERSAPPIQRIQMIQKIQTIQTIQTVQRAARIPKVQTRQSAMSAPSAPRPSPGANRLLVGEALESQETPQRDVASSRLPTGPDEVASAVSEAVETEHPSAAEGSGAE